jgi:hypothetical protein
MALPQDEKAASSSVSSIRTTSSMSSLKALFKKSEQKEKPRRKGETMEEKFRRREATAMYLAMR